MKSMTPRQKEVLEFIRSFVRENRYPPTIREISEAFGISVKGAHDHVRALEKKQVIRYDAKRSRTIEVLADSAEGVREEIREVPVIGSVAAGLPILAEENYDGTVAVAASSLPAGACFAVRVRGDSMSGAGILDGDIAVIAQQPVAENGQIVVAMVDDAVTIKRFYRERSRVQLKAENPDYGPIYTRDVRILGRLTQVIRRYD